MFLSLHVYVFVMYCWSSCNLNSSINACNPELPLSYVIWIQYILCYVIYLIRSVSLAGWMLWYLLVIRCLSHTRGFCDGWVCCLVSVHHVLFPFKDLFWCGFLFVLWVTHTGTRAWGSTTKVSPYQCDTQYQSMAASTWLPLSSGSFYIERSCGIYS